MKLSKIYFNLVSENSYIASFNQSECLRLVQTCVIPMHLCSKIENSLGGHVLCVRKTGQSAIAPWYRLRLPSCDRGFESQAHHLCFLQNVQKFDKKLNLPIMRLMACMQSAFMYNARSTELLRSAQQRIRSLSCLVPILFNE